jgi:hypothetical protein
VPISLNASVEAWVTAHPRLNQWLPAHAKNVIAAVGALAAAVISLLTSLNAVHWVAAQTSLVSTESAAVLAFISAVLAHVWPDTKQQPVAVAASLTALVTATVALGTGFSWWTISPAQSSALVAVLSSGVGLGSALVARSKVTAPQSVAVAVLPGQPAPNQPDQN